MNYSNEFNDLIECCIKENQIVGIGNPNAKILFVGKEAGIPIDEINFHGSGTSWKDTNVNYYKRFPAESNIRNGNHTWQKYQKLYELINEKKGLPIDSKIDNYEITFVEEIFTTELSNLHAPKSNQAKKLQEFKSNLANRKKVFWKHPFIQKFPIVVIFATDNKYIETYKGELCELFDVEYSDYIAVGKAKIWIHLAKNDKQTNYPKMVLHTRQLTNGASIELIEELALIISEFMKSNEL